MGAQRWIDLGIIRLQPSELMKIGLVMFLAAYYDWLPMRKVSHPFWVLVPLMFIGLPVALTLIQPDLGTAILLTLGGGAVMFLAGVHWLYFGTVIAAGVGTVMAVIESRGTPWQLLKDYQFRRIDTFLDPANDPLGAGYHITQAKIALGSGGWTGRGFMQGTQSRLNFLPEKHTDFIFTTLAEEFGFIGSVTLLLLYAGIIFFCVDLGADQPRPVLGAADAWRRGDAVSLLLGQHGDGHGSGAGGRRAAAARLLRRLGDAGAAARLWPGAERARPQAAMSLGLRSVCGGAPPLPLV